MQNEYEITSGAFRKRNISALRELSSFMNLDVVENHADLWRIIRNYLRSQSRLDSSEVPHYELTCS